MPRRALSAPATASALLPGGIRLRPDLREPGAPKELEVIQLTTDPNVPSSHIYMEAQIFAPGSKRFVLQRSGHAHGSDRKDPQHQFLLCDIEDRFLLHPLTDEVGTTGPAISPDGKYFYYFVDQTGQRRERLTLMRVKLDGTDRERLLVIDGALPGTRFRPTRIYPLSTISSDGRKLAISACLDKSTDPVQFGLMVFDLEKAAVEVAIHGPTWTNMHPQFCRSTDPESKHDILIQENHGRLLAASGEVMPSADTAGVDIHVVRDDGSNPRDLPWGRDGTERCEGHQCWRGRTGWAITSVGSQGTAHLIEGRPAAPAGHRGLNTPGGIRNILSREFAKPRFHHFAVDIAGRRLVTDYEKTAEAGRIYIARLGRPGEEPLKDFRCIARPRSTGQKDAHTHPFLSPDGRMAFFNSDESGVLQAYAIRGLPG